MFVNCPRGSQSFPRARSRSATEHRRWEGSYGQSGCPRQPSAAQRREHLGGISVGQCLKPCVVGVPATSMFSFTVKGTPWNGPRSAPAATARSAALPPSAPARP